MTKAPFVRIPRDWELSEREVTEESLHRNRREIINDFAATSFIKHLQDIDNVKNQLNEHDI